MRSTARRALAIGVVAALAFTAAPVVATASNDGATKGSLRTAVTDAILARAELSAGEAAQQGRETQFKVDRRDGRWATGTAVLTAPAVEGAYPTGWLFVARRGAGGWTVGLEGSQRFADLGGAAPATVVVPRERHIFTTGGARTMAVSSDNTGLMLPYAQGATWTLTGGPHGTNMNAVDLAGGDGRVLAAGGGTAKMMCSSQRGWIRIYHSNGYASDYYHLHGNINPGGGTAVARGAFLGYIGTDVSCGGSATGNHVHFSIYVTGSPDAAKNLTSTSFGKWVFWPTTAYNGYATHGSTVRYPGGGLYNYGVLGSNQGIVDSNGGTSVNKRSGPGTGYAIVGSVADGATITISCWRYGTSHTGRYGTTSVWDKLTDGTWVSDAYVYTGRATIGPQC
ncbi:MAG TPA: peptidoglycan DD-metalloendopeptidase family protein [Actinomycetota bacterium]|nr:peptidoglycan DD-metalloendopeptidase family protein [Actinomycetota bacterium]